MQKKQNRKEGKRNAQGHEVLIKAVQMKRNVNKKTNI